MGGGELFELGGVIDPRKGGFGGEWETGAGQPGPEGPVRGAPFGPEGYPRCAAAGRPVPAPYGPAPDGDRGGEEFPFC